MALIYKHLLDILKFESDLSGEGRWNYKGFEELLPFCVAFRDSIRDSDTGDADRLNILPKALKCTARLLSKLVSLVDSQVSHEKLALVVIEIMHQLFHLLRSGSQSTERPQQIQRALVDDQASVVVIYLHLLTILEGVAQTAPLEDGPVTQSGVDKEPLTELTLELYQSLITAVYLPDASDGAATSIDVLEEGIVCSHKLNTSFEGPLGSQAVLSLLTLVKHRSKRVANNAAACLLLTMRCFGAQRNTWRACFPGTFSGLFLVTQSGFKSGSVLLSRSTQALLQLVYIVGRDSLPENEQLQRHFLVDTGVRDPAAQGTGSADRNAFGKLLKQLHLPASTTGSGQETPAATVADKEGEQYVQWRVQVLQRIQQPLAVAYREACKACTATQRVTLAMALAKVVGQCAAFLGTACVTTCVAALLCGVAEDTTVVRAAAQRAWDDLQSALQTSKYLPRDAYLRLNDGLSQRYLDSVRGASAAALIGNEGKLKDHLHILLGLGFGLRDHIQSLVRIADHSRVLVRMVRDLLAPDPGVCGLRITASVLETRCYTYQTSVLQSGLTASALHAVEAGYHRVAWRSTQDTGTKELAMRLVLTLARYGLLEDMVTGARRASESLQRSLDSAPQAGASTAGVTVSRKTQTGVSAVAECVCKAAGALSACNIAVLSIAAVSAVEATATASISRSQTVEMNCAYCGKSAKPGTPAMLRCSRCKGVHYCSKEHQQHHWKLHKTLCTPATAAPAPASGTTATSEVASNAAVVATVDLDSPTSLLTSSLVRVTPLSAQGGAELRVYSAAKLRYLISSVVRQYVDVMQHYRALRNSTTVVRSEAGSGSGAPQWAAYVLLAATAAEGLGNLAFSLGSAFQDHLRQALYPLLELLVDTEPIVKQAARSSLERIALYTMQATLPRLIRANLDYIVDTVCRQLRSPSTTSTMRIYSSSSGSSGGIVTGAGCAAAHLIVDEVFTLLGASIQQSSEVGSETATERSDIAPMCLLRDVICDTLENIDAFSVESRYGSVQLQALLRVLRVLASRAAPAPDKFTIPVYAARGKSQPVKEVGDDKPTAAVGPAMGAKEAVASLMDFAQNLLLLKRAEDVENVVVTEGENPILEAAQKKGEDEAAAEEKGEENDADNDATPALTPAVQLLLDVLERCCLFLTLPHTASQLTVVETMVAAFVRLSPKQHSVHLLPCIHRTWPVVLNRIKELTGILCQRSDPMLALAGSSVSSGSARSTGTSKVLLTAETASPQTSVLATPLLTAVSTTRRTPSTIVASAVEHTSASSSGGSEAGPPQNAEVARALVLPALYELVGVLTVASGSFMTIKLKQELLPEVFRLLAHNLLEYAAGQSSASGVAAGIGGAKGKLTMAQLLLTQRSDDDNRSGAEGLSAGAAAASGDGPLRVASKHTVWSKVKYAVLALLRQCCAVEDGVQRVIRAEVAAIVFLCLPLLSGHESQEVQDAAAALVADLRVLDAATVHTTLQSVRAPQTAASATSAEKVVAKVTKVPVSAGVSTAEEEHAATKRWRAVVHCPQVVAAVSAGRSAAQGATVANTGRGKGASAMRVVPRAEDLRRQYLRDKVLQNAVAGLLNREIGAQRVGSVEQSGHSGLVRDAEWLKRLEQWAIV